jgi:hypothetical protein
MTYETVFNTRDELAEYVKVRVQYSDKISYFDPTAGWVLRNERFTSDEDTLQDSRIDRTRRAG